LNKLFCLLVSASIFMEGFDEYLLPTGQQRIVDGAIFPLCVTHNNENDGNEDKIGTVLQAIHTQHAQLDDLLRRHKCILFRDCGLHTAQDLHEFIVSTGVRGMDYVGGAAVRTQITDRVFTANESPSSENIPFHHEMA
jgi:hypothetical protein